MGLRHRSRVSSNRHYATWLSIGSIAFSIGFASDGDAFPHIVQDGETLADIAEDIYGRVEYEQVLVAANSLDVAGGGPIVPGMRLEVPAVGHHRIRAGETWEELASLYLGDASRSDLLATSNKTMPWLPPQDGRDIIIPYNLRYVARTNDSTLTLAYRFLGERDRAWMLDRYNHLGGDPIQRGDVLLVPLTDLPLTDVGKERGRAAGALVRSEGDSADYDAQRKVEKALPELAQHVRQARYVEAVGLGNRLLGAGELARPQLASIQRLLTEAYVALGAEGQAQSACLAWRRADPEAALDPVLLSPKILRACTRMPTSEVGLVQPPAAVSTAESGVDQADDSDLQPPTSKSDR